MNISGSGATSAGASVEANVAIQKKQMKQEEAVVGKILQGAEQASERSAAHATGQRLNVTA